MCINSNKSCFLHNDLDEDLLRSISSILPYKFDFLNKGFVYLGYFLKPSGYLIKDWHWLVKKIEKMISNWTNRFLYLGGAQYSSDRYLQVYLFFGCPLCPSPFPSWISSEKSFSLFFGALHQIIKSFIQLISSFWLIRLPLGDGGLKICLALVFHLE